MYATNEQTVDRERPVNDELPSLPPVTEYVLEELDKPLPSFKDVENVVRRDATLAAYVIRYAKMWGTESGVRITGLLHAIKYIGMGAIRGIAVQHAVQRRFTAPENPDFDRDGFWKYSLATGIACELLAEHLGFDSRGVQEAFSTGHLHAIGLTMMDQHSSESFSELLSYLSEHPREWHRAEKEIMGVTHCELGAELFEAWNLPDNWVHVARDYVSPPEDCNVFVSMAHVGSVVSKIKGYGTSLSDDIEYLEESQFERLNLQSHDIKRLLHDDLPRRYTSIVESFHDGNPSSSRVNRRDRR